MKVILTVVLLCVSFGFSAPVATQAAPEDRPASYVCLYYKVKRGDTLTKIAVRYGTTVKTLMSVNRLRSTRILIGQTLCIPRNNPPNPQPQPGPWHGEYWNNPDQMGPAAVTRSDRAVNFNWGWGSPDPRIIADFFSARFTRSDNFAWGDYRFTLKSDGGLRVWLDGNVIFDNYGHVGRLETQVDVGVAAGPHTIRVDYVDRGGIATVYVSYAKVAPGPGPQPKPCPQCPPAEQNGPWYTEFYHNPALSGPPGHVTSYNALSFDWGWNPPVPGFSNMNWSARFTQYRYLPAGVYRFVAKSDDGVRIWVDDKLVINQWVEQSARTVTGDVAVGGGTHFIKVEYMQLGGVALLRSYWEFLGNP
jgi:hypothetical protein